MARNFPKLMRFQTTDLGSSENTNQETTPRHIYSKCRKPKTEKILNKAGDAE